MKAVAKLLLQHTARLRYPIGLGLVLLTGAALRFYRLSGQSLWSDEGNSVALAQAGLGEIAARTALDIHPPLYYWLLHGWIRLFGQSEVAVRSLSALAGVLLVAVVYRLGVRLSPTQRTPAGRGGPQLGQRIGLLAAFVAALSPFQVHYAQEARMYALLAFLGALTVWATLELIEASSDTIPTDWALLYVLSAALGLYTHYAFPLVLAATNLAVLIHWLVLATGPGSRGPGQAPRSRLIGWLGLQLVPLALYLPWLPIAWRQLTTWPAPAANQAGNVYLSVWRTLVLGPVGARGSEVWLVTFGLLGLIGTFRLTRREPLSRAALVLFYGGLPVGLTLALFKPAYLKFLLVASPALCLLVALGVAAGWRGKGALGMGWLGAGLVVATAWGPLTAYYTDPTAARDDYRGMAHYLEAVAGKEDAIILNAAGQQEVFGYYYRGHAPVFPLPRRRPLDASSTVAELETILAQAEHIYAIYWATEESDPEGIIQGWLDGHAFKASDAWVGNVRLVSYAVPLPAGDLPLTDVRLGDHVTLTGYRLLSPPPDEASSVISPPSGCEDCAARSLARTVPGEIVQIQLRWVTDVTLDTNYVVFMQVLDAANHLVGQRDAEPVIPTGDWEPGQPVLDLHGLLIEPGTPPGEHRVIAGLYDTSSGQRLPISSQHTTASSGYLELGVLNIELPGTPPSPAALRFRHPAQADLGPLRLLGYDLHKLGHSYDPDAPLHAGDPLHLVLYWQAKIRPQTDWRLALRLVPMTDPTSTVAEGIFPAAGVDYPATNWEPGDIVRAQFDLFLPGDAPPGGYRLSLQLLDEAGLPGTDTITLVPISVE